MVYATVDDVQSAYEKPIPEDLATFVATQLEFANTLLDVRVPSLTGRLAATPALSVLARKAVVEAVVRLLRNPDGFKGEHAGEYGYYYAEGSARGRVDFSPEDLADLQPSGRRGSFRSVGLSDDALCEPTRYRRRGYVWQGVVTDAAGDIVYNPAQQAERDWP